ncbi:MAG: exopolysaccharide biosynthesis polyprenyl glycosylphosphotransferase [Spirochaetes bacterium]|nr:exopolysaccharide biosynthesis polyprenyl glycosylphosphotransferase [Spirochaetota bacterium]
MFNFNRFFFAIIDLLIAFCLFLLIFALRYIWFSFPEFSQKTLDLSTILLFSFYSIVIVIFFFSFKVYELNKLYKLTEVLLYLPLISLLSMGIFGIYFFLTQTNFTRFVFFSGFLFVPLIIAILNKILFHLLIQNRQEVHILYLGNADHFQLLQQLFKQYKKIFKLHLGKIDLTTNTATIAQRLKEIHYLVIDSDFVYNRELFDTLTQFEIHGGRIFTLIDIFAYFDQSLPAEIITNTNHFELFSTYKLDSLYNRFFKRIGDILIAFFLLIMVSPILLLTIFLVKITSPGKIFYIQKRMGLNNREFKMFKFRTMVSDAEKGKAQLTSTNDQRITFIGKIIRPLRIDELPQLINILKGDMSFIGPRPERKELIEVIVKKYPLFQKRQLVKPGLTGWAQVRFFYVNDLDQMNKKLSYDLYYINHLSLQFDLKIILYTIETILFKREHS